MSHRANPRRRIGWRSLVSIGVLLFLLLLAAFFIWQANCQPGPSVMGQLRQITGNSVTIGKEEADFYQGLAGQDMDKTAYASRVYAQFLAGERLGVCGPYSFESLKAELAQENEQRRLKKEQGEKLEGPAQFDLAHYLPYRLEQIRDASVALLVENPSGALLANSKAYWEANQDKFAVVREITVELRQNGSTERKVFKKSELAEMGSQNPQLQKLLYSGKEGQSFEYEYNGDKITGEILSVKKETATFEEATQAVLTSYMANVEYPQLIDLIAANNPVTVTQ